MVSRKGELRVSNQHSEAFQSPDFFDNSDARHKDAVELEGLDHIFKWASEMVADSEDSRAKMAREKRIRRQVLEIVQKARETKILAQANEEIAYLQRRVIALLDKLQELNEENSTAKQLVVGQYYMLQRIPALESEVKQLKCMQYEREAAVTERRYLMDALAKVKADRDMMEEVLSTCELENTRLAGLLAETRIELDRVQSRRWWHAFMPWKYAV